MDRLREAVVSLFRVVTGLLFACHGAATLFGVLGGPHDGRIPAVGAWPDWWAGAIELGAGGLVLVGLATRAAALLCSGTMAYAYFTVHLPKGLFPIMNGGEPAALFSWSFLLVALLGGGAWSLDTLLTRSRRHLHAHAPVHQL
ncbi:DoxX family protein [Sphaerisporangium fuscum]|uniref:DoxX family protein n=1 Tax=Sphaerisporangium fuscum TaxID=2835868 RepID=UPI001BDD3321|nr:DoxX family protein [Sphaerisporangium fuscum]